MTTLPASASDRHSAIRGDDVARSAKAEHVARSVAMTRMMGMETASMLLGGKPALAEVLDVTDRALRYKLTGDRSISNAELVATSDALDARAAKLAAHASKLRAEARS